MIDFEVGDIIFWVSINNSKPFPVNIYRKNGTWIHKAHKKLTDEERMEVEGFFKSRVHDMFDAWKPNMKSRLTWQQKEKG